MEQGSRFRTNLLKLVYVSKNNKESHSRVFFTENTLKNWPNATDGYLIKRSCFVRSMQSLGIFGFYRHKKNIQNDNFGQSFLTNLEIQDSTAKNTIEN